ncbi:MAG: HAMP domain-containing protein, partial [Spirochaetaceae bacterium]|nr:HAMP domain-containing protein [Spirochaetaceae bacterium]
LLVYVVSSIMVMMGILGLREAMNDSINKSEQINMLFRYNTLSSRITLLAKDLILDTEKINSQEFISGFQYMKTEIETLMDTFLDMQVSAEDRNTAIRIFGGSSKLLEIIENALILPLQKGEAVNLSLVDDAINERGDILNIIDAQVSKLESEKLKILDFGDNLAGKVVRNSAIFILVAILLVIITSLLLVRVIVSPVKKAAFMLRDVAEGEGDLTKSLTVISKDEIGDLSNHFNQFIDRLKGIILNIKDGSRDNLKLEKELKNSSDKTVESIGLIKGSLDSMGERIDLLNSDILRSTDVVEQMSRSIASLNDQAADQSAMAEESSAAVTEMIASVDSVALITKKKKEATDLLVDNARKGGEMLSETVKAVQEINESIDSISALTGIIARIASQTNLLSMNAAIEAAHAGDAGKGFAVVADEIRKLAETTSDNSKEISNVLKTVIGRIKTAVEMSGSTQRAFSEINNEIAGVTSALGEINASTHELKSGGSEVLDAMIVLRDSSVSVKGSVNDIDKGSDEVRMAMTSIKKLSSEVVGEISCITEGTENISRAADEVEKISSLLSRTATAMADEVNKFKT